ncbi:hypothetical protein [Defluviimonas sp. SAOS-178_SWC]|uniref:hypothetical protein n=1 Tax=Defluviimonas sp. SAOS-178_SWC TaxID=3121287 RepID=UPI003221A625
MTDLVEKARLGRTNALSHISRDGKRGLTPRRDSLGHRSIPLAFVSNRAKLGTNGAFA